VTVVEDPESATSGEMPQAALSATKVDWVLALEEIAPRLEKLVSAVAVHYGS
jgi:chemotaxis response regulator CheB